MALSRSIRVRKLRRRKGHHFELQLTSMMDALIIIVVFMLRSYSVSLHNFETVQGLELPVSTSQDLPTESLQVIVTPEGITFEGERVLDFVQTGDITTESAAYEFKKTDLDSDNKRIVPLYDALKKARERSELLRVKSQARDEKGNPLKFDDVIAIQADKRVNYDTVRKIMFTAGDAGYRVFRFLARKNET